MKLGTPHPPQSTDTTLVFGAYQLTLPEPLLVRDGELVQLPPKVLDLLVVLVKHAGQVLSRERLMDMVWPDTFVEESNLNYTISLLRKVLGEEANGTRFIKTIPKRGYRFVAEISADISQSQAVAVAANSNPAHLSSDELEPVGGAVPLDSPFYLQRNADHEFHAALKRRDSIVLINGPRQVGKTSLLARGLQEARAAGAQVVLTDFQSFNEADLASPEKLFLTLAELLARRLRLAVTPHDAWDDLLSPNLNFEEYLLQHVLADRAQPLVWGMDEVDRLFGRSFANDFFGLLRSWHNARALDPSGEWRNLVIALSYATEAHLFITDLNQSPFNVGTHLPLRDFTVEQVAEMNRRYGSPLISDDELSSFYALLGGNPYLVRRGLHELRVQEFSFAQLAANAAQPDGPYSGHLRRLLLALQRDADLCEQLRPLLNGKESKLTANGFFRLRSAGLLEGASAKDARIRCELYRQYLQEQLG